MKEQISSQKPGIGKSMRQKWTDGGRGYEEGPTAGVKFLGIGG